MICNNNLLYILYNTFFCSLFSSLFLWFLLLKTENMKTDAKAFLDKDGEFNLQMQSNSNLLILN